MMSCNMGNQLIAYSFKTTGNGTNEKKLYQYFDLKKIQVVKKVKISRKNWKNFMKALGHYLMYRLGKCTNFATVLVQEKKEPVQEQFLSNQKFQKMYIGSTDKRTTKRNKKTLQRKWKIKVALQQNLSFCQYCEYY